MKNQSPNSTHSTLCGNLDTVSAVEVCGWLADRAHFNQVLRVEILVDGVIVGNTVANVYRQDLEDAGIGNGLHAFVFKFPEPLKQGRYKIVARVAGQGLMIKGSGIYEIVPQLNPSLSHYEGGIDFVSSKTCVGWCWRKDSPEQNPVMEILVDGVVAGECCANKFREDLSKAGIGNGNYGFTFVLPPQFSSANLIAVRVKGEKELLCSPKKVASAQDIGFVERVTEKEVLGWCILLNTPNESADIAVELDGVTLGRGKCVTFREDVWAQYGGHGFYGFLIRLSHDLVQSDYAKLAVKIMPSGVKLPLPSNGAKELPKGTSKQQDKELLPPVYKGFLDKATRNEICGWVVNESDPATPVTLQLYVNDLLVSNVKADQIRKDVKGYPASQQRLGFAIALEPTGSVLQDVSIVLKTEDGKFKLGESPRNFCWGPPGKRYNPKHVIAALQQQRISATLPVPAPLHDQPQIDIIVLNLNGEDFLKDLFSSFHKVNTWPNYEFIIVDNGSTDNSKSVCAAWSKQLSLRFVERGKNYSFSESNNYGVALSNSPILLFLNNDIIFCEDILGSMAAFFSDPKVGMVGIRLDSVPGSINSSWSTFGYQVSHMQHIGIKFASDFGDRAFLPYEMRAIEPGVGIPEGPVRVPSVTAALMMMTRQDFDAIGGFHEGYYYGYEDVDISLAVDSLLGKQVVCATHLKAYHHRSASLKKLSTDTTLIDNRSRNRLVLVERCGEYLRHRLRQERVGNETFLRSHRVRVALLVSETKDDTSCGDYFTAIELAESLTKATGWDCYLVPTEQWYDLQTFDVAIALVNGFIPSNIETASAHLVLIVWVRNWFDSWLDSPYIQDFDQIWVSSKKAHKAFSAKHSRPVHLIRIATNAKAFEGGTYQEEFQSDYCFTGSFFGAWRKVVGCLNPAELPYKFALFGHNWGKVTWLADYYRGPLPYSAMPDVYASSKIVIDDANHTTIAWGGANSRVFDALAAGCLVFTNSQETSNDVFDGQLPVFNSKEELSALLEYYLTHEEERKALVNSLRETVLTSHTYDHRASEAATAIRAGFASLRANIQVPRTSVDLAGFVNTLRTFFDGPELFIFPSTQSTLNVSRVRGNDVSIYTTDLDNSGHLEPRAESCVRLLLLLCSPDALSPMQARMFDVVIVPDNDAAEKVRQMGVAHVLALTAHVPELDDNMSRSDRKLILQMLYGEHLRNALPDIMDLLLKMVEMKATIQRSIAKDHQVAIKSLAQTKTLQSLKLAYVLWDFPALSQTFVLNELRWLVSHGVDVKVYFKVDPDKAATLDFEIDSWCVSSVEELRLLLRRHERNVIHSHFAYPAAALLAYPAAVAEGIPYTFMVHAVDICHYDNMKRNKVGEVASNPLCLKVVTLGQCHRKILLESKVPDNKILMERQASSLFEFHERPFIRSNRQAVVIGLGRFIEKKGFGYLIEAAHLLPNVKIQLYGYGPLEDELRRQAHGLANVEFCGVLNSKEEVAQAFQNADLMAMPCVRAENGDMDGLPTVLFEAMSAGLPVVATDVSNIPDLVKDELTGFVCRPRDSADLAAAINRVLQCDPQRMRRIIHTARDMARTYSSIDTTMHTLTNLWTEQTVDIVLVTYDKGKHKSFAATQEIISRIYKFTTLKFNLIVVDNNSDPDFIRDLNESFGSHDNFSLITLPENILCGPASNIGIRAGSSKYIIYICSKEGFVLKSGWERGMIDFMDNNAEVAMAGHLVTMPKHFTGASYRDHKLFNQFRNQQFASENPTRPFAHVQGGLYILRRKAFEEVGGFNDATPHDAMDVEYSYFLESCGWRIAQLPKVWCHTVKTRPTLTSILDEFTVAAHPLIASDIMRADEIVNARVKSCNLCGWFGEHFMESGLCPQCSSTSFSRSIMREFGSTGLLQQRPNMVLVTDDVSLKMQISSLCNSLTIHPLGSLEQPGMLKHLLGNPVTNILVLDHMAWTNSRIEELRTTLPQFLKYNGVLLLGENVLYGSSPASSYPGDFCRVSLQEALKGVTATLTVLRNSSQVLELDWRDIFAITRG